MRWNENDVASFNREEQITALRYVQNVVCAMAERKQDVETTEKQLEVFHGQVEKMKKGLTFSTKLLLALILLIGGKIILPVKFMTMLVIVILVWIAFTVVDKQLWAPQRLKKAEDYEAEHLPQLEAEHGTALARYQEISQSDDAYNAHLLLPDTYLSLDKIQNLIELLESRRVRTLTDAMTVYETNEHHRRVESIEQQRLQATQQAAEEQRRAADAAEDRLRETKRMAAEQRSALQDQQRKLAQMSSKRETVVIKEASRSQEKRGSTITCFHCKMQVPSKATTCPYCRKDPTPSIKESINSFLGFR